MDGEFRVINLIIDPLRCNKLGPCLARMMARGLAGLARAFALSPTHQVRIRGSFRRRQASHGPSSSLDYSYFAVVLQLLIKGSYSCR